MEGWKLGVVKYDSFWIIRDDTLCENCSTCFRMYRRKASLDHRPIIMIVNVGTLARYMAMAEPDLMECVPISSGSKPRLSFPICAAADRSLVRTVADVIVLSLPLMRTVLMGESQLVPG